MSNLILRRKYAGVLQNYMTIFFESNTVMLCSIGLIVNLPQSYLVYLDSLPMKKRNLTGWVQLPKKRNQMKRTMVKAARTFNMTTLRMKSLVSDVGLKIRGREQEWFAPTVYDATYQIMWRAVTT